MAKVVAQIANPATPIASNPASGVNNIPMTPQNGQAMPAQGMAQPGQAPAIGGTAPAGGNIDPDALLDVLDDLSRANPNEVEKFQAPIEQNFDQSQNPHIKQRLQSILNALHMTNDPMRQTTDPSTGKKDPTAGELAASLAEEIENMTEQTQTAQAGAYNYYRSAAKKKKKTRGNPFRVLMGQVGKLLDHGMEKRDIVRYLDNKGMFNKETIEKAVDIVRDYNKKIRRDDHKNKALQKETEEDINERLSSVTKETHPSIAEIDNTEESLTMSKDQKKASVKPYNVYNKLAQNFKLEIDAEDEAPKKAEETTDDVIESLDKAEDAKYKKSFVYNHAERLAEKAAKTVYDSKPNFELRSTSELMARASWLTSLQNFTGDSHSEGRTAADTKGAAAELKSIKAALKKRGYDSQEIEFK